MNIILEKKKKLLNNIKKNIIKNLISKIKKESNNLNHFKLIKYLKIIDSKCKNLYKKNKISNIKSNISFYLKKKIFI